MISPDIKIQPKAHKNSELTLSAPIHVSDCPDSSPACINDTNSSFFEILVFLGLHLRHMEVPRLEVEWGL